MVSRTRNQRNLASPRQRRSSFRGKVSKNARRLREQRRAEQRLEFPGARYNDLRTNPFPDQPNYARHVNLFDLNVLHFDGRAFSQPALAIYPVIASRANYYENTWLQLSLDNIGQLAGLNRKTACEAIDEMVAANNGIDEEDGHTVPFLERTWKDNGARQFWLYRIAMARPGLWRQFRGEYFPFYTAIIDSSLWQGLRPRAKALYLALRTEARLDPELHDAVENTEMLRDATGLREGLYPETYASRRFEVYVGTIAHVCRLAGISASHANKPLDELQRAGLVVREATWTDEPTFRVYLLPAHWNRD